MTNENDSDDEAESYLVGPGKPPKQHRFRHGVSGNPRGRPKGSFSMPALIQKESLRKYGVAEAGRDKKRNPPQVVARRITMAAMKGDYKMTVLYLQELAKAAEVGTGPHSSPIVPHLDAAATRRIAERVLRNLDDQEAAARKKETDDEPD